MLASQPIHTEAASYDISEKHTGFASTSGRFEGGPLAEEMVK
jgi:hypothetical protein